jgi:hypothetical protein
MAPFPFPAHQFYVLRFYGFYGVLRVLRGFTVRFYGFYGFTVTRPFTFYGDTPVITNFGVPRPIVFASKRSRAALQKGKEWRVTVIYHKSQMRAAPRELLDIGPRDPLPRPAPTRGAGVRAPVSSRGRPKAMTVQRDRKAL